MEDKNLQNKILEQIKSGKVEMTPRRYFLFKWGTLLVLSLFFILLSLYVFGFIIFLLTNNGLVYLPFSGLEGLTKFIVEVPWTLVLLGCLGVFMFSKVSKTFYRVYKKPFLTFFFSIIMIIILSNFLLVEFGVMKYLKQKAFDNNFSPVPDKFKQFRESQTGNIFVGHVVATETEKIVLVDRHNSKIILELDKNQKYLLKTIKQGDILSILGERNGATVTARNVQIVTEY